MLPEIGSAALLLVDDHPANLLALESILRPLGFPIVTAASGQEALLRAREHDFLLVVMDVQMPGLDGYATVEQMRRLERIRDVPIVFLTAVYERTEHVRRGYALGAVDYVTKPFDPEVLRAKVAAFVALYTRGLREERARRDEMDRLKDLLLGAVGHDLRNPLNTFLVSVQFLRERAVDDYSRRAAERGERAVRRMTAIIEDVLDLTSVKFVGSLPLKREPVDLVALCRQVIAEVGATHPGRPVDLEVLTDAVGEWDPTRVGRVVSNLITNAVQHATAGRVAVRVTGDEQAVSLIVRNGGAIAAGVLPRLFDPFQRGDTSAEGRGLGLYIVKQTAEAHGGSVAVTSAAEDGTTFTVTLPRRARPRDEQRAPPPRPIEAAAPAGH